MHACSGLIVSLPLQRRLHKRFEHGLLALLIIAALAGLALMAARPLPAASAADAAGAPVSALPDTSAAGEHVSPRKRTTIRRSRQSLAMPYFSFAAGN